jgi:hypothetical protein
VRGSLDGKPRPRKIFDSHDPGSIWSTPSLTYSPDRAFNANHSHQRGHNASDVGTTSASNLTFTAHPRMGNKRQPLFPPRLALFAGHIPGLLGLGLIHFPSTLLDHVPTQPRLPLVEQKTMIRTSTTGSRMSPTAPRYLAVPSSTSPRRPGMASTYHSTSLQQRPQCPSYLLLQDTPRVFIVYLGPLLVSIKGEG